MKSLAQIPRTYILASIGVLLICTTLIALVVSFDSTEISPVQTEQQYDKLTIQDIESIYVHIGLDIECPDIQGVSQHGYVYTALLNGKKAAIERLGCGVGEPEVFAAAIAQDLENNANFEKLPSEQTLQKMTFKFYELNNN